MGRQDLAELLQRLRGKRGQGSAGANEGVGGQHPWPAGIGEDAEVGPLRTGLFGQHLRHVEEIFNVIHPQHAAAAEGRIQNRVAAGEGSRVGGRRLGRRLGAPRLDDDDGLAQRHLAGRRQKRPRIPDGFHVEDDAVGMGILAQVVDEIPPAHIQHRSQGDKGAKADIFLQAPV